MATAKLPRLSRRSAQASANRLALPAVQGHQHGFARAQPHAHAARRTGRPVLLGRPPAGESNRLELARQDLQRLAFEAHHPAGEDGFDGHDRSVHAAIPTGKTPRPGLATCSWLRSGKRDPCVPSVTDLVGKARAIVTGKPGWQDYIRRVGPAAVWACSCCRAAAWMSICSPASRRLVASRLRLDSGTGVRAASPVSMCARMCAGSSSFPCTPKVFWPGLRTNAPLPLSTPWSIRARPLSFASPRSLWLARSLCSSYPPPRGWGSRGKSGIHVRGNVRGIFKLPLHDEDVLARAAHELALTAEHHVFDTGKALVFRQRQQSVADPFALFVVLASVALVEAANVAADLFKHRIVPRTVRAAFDILTSTKRIAGDVLAGESAIDFRRCLLIADRRQPAFLAGFLELAHTLRHAMPPGALPPPAP